MLRTTWKWDGTMAIIRGDNQNELVFGTPEADRILTLGGSDTALGNGGNDAIRGGLGDDFLDGGEGDDLVVGGGGFDVLRGGGGDDVILGGGGDKSGGAAQADGDDFLDGGAGDDVLDGFAGDDWLAGGGDNDTFFFFPNEGSDNIVDFTRGEDFLNVIEGFGIGFAEFDTDGNGVLNGNDADVTVGPAALVLDFTDFNSPTQLYLLGVGELDANDFIAPSA